MAVSAECNIKGRRESSPAPGSLFIATTALKTTWPEFGPDVFLGDWCFCFPEDINLASDAVLTAYPWANLEARTKGLEFCNALTVRVARDLAPFFSTVLREKIDQRGANLLLFSALGTIVTTAYYNFICLQAAIAQFGPLRSVGLRRQDYVVPETTGMLISQLRGDEFQLQLFSELCPALGIFLELKSRSDLFPKFSSTTSERVCAASQPRRNVLDQLLREVTKAILRSQSRHADCVLYNSSLSVAEAVLLAAKSRFRIGILPVFKLDSVVWPRPLASLRNEFAAELSSILNDDPFQTALCRLLPTIWPISLLEGIDVLKTVVFDNFPARPKTIVSGMAWYVDDAFKLWCLQSRERGARLVSCQHGGGYGKRRSVGLGEQLEYLVADKFIAWGGSENPANSCIPLPVPPHFFVKPSHKIDERILYVGTTMARWVSIIMDCPFGPMYLDYLDRQIDFWRSLPSELQAKLLLRSNPVELGWSSAERLRQEIPAIVFDDFSRSFEERLRHAKLAVIDNLNTTYLQSMGSGVPTILVWDPEVWATNQATSACLDNLEEAGVYFRCPKAAAEAVTHIWRDPQQWWRTPKVANAVDSFLDQFLNRKRNWTGPWLCELQH